MSMPAVLFVKKLRLPEPTPELTLLPIDKQVLLMIAVYTSKVKRIAWPSVRKLATDCLKKERSIQRSLSRLEKAKLLHRQCGGGLRTTTYRIVGFSPIPEAGAPVVNDATPPKPAAPPPVSSVTPTPVTHDTQPPSSVTPPYKEYESTCERTLKGEVQPPPQTLASQVIETLSLPNVPGLVRTVEAAISAEANHQHIEPAAAARFISDWCAAARAHGVPINKFAFEDTIWRSNGQRKVSPGEDRFSHNRNVAHAVVSNLLNGGAERYVRDYQNKTRSLHS